MNETQVYAGAGLSGISLVISGIIAGMIIIDTNNGGTAASWMPCTLIAMCILLLIGIVLILLGLRDSENENNAE